MSNKRVLTINVYFAPRSFGGATIVAEEISKRLNTEHGWDVSAFTSMREASLPDYSYRRYKAKGVDCFAVNLPAHLSFQQGYKNPEVASIVKKVVDAIRPDVVHIHSIQTLGCDFFDVLVERDIPFAVTLHDCWWVCERQFMINNSGQYCFQKTIKKERCRYCVDDFYQSEQRLDYLRTQLSKADLLLFPSKFHHDFHLQNGFDPKKLRINKNGIQLPQAKTGLQAEQVSRELNLGFIGGPGPIKGADIIVKALNDMDRKDYTLKVVDAARNVGSTWVDGSYWDIPGRLEFVPPYNQDTMDEFFASIDVLLFPSQWKESFGLTVREALARDVWVIATDAGGVSEDLIAGENASVIPLDGDFKKLRVEIEECMDKNWITYENKHKHLLRAYAEQASELSDYLLSLMSKA